MVSAIGVIRRTVTDRVRQSRRHSLGPERQGLFGCADQRHLGPRFAMATKSSLASPLWVEGIVKAPIVRLACDSCARLANRRSELDANGRPLRQAPSRARQRRRGACQVCGRAATAWYPNGKIQFESRVAGISAIRRAADVRTSLAWPRSRSSGSSTRPMMWSLLASS